MKLNLITKARVEDAAAITRLLNAAYRGDGSRQGWTTEADLLSGVRTTTQEVAGLIGRSDTFILKGMVGNEIVATICCELQNEDTAHFGMIAVEPDLQNQGHGKQVIRAAELMAYSEWQVKYYKMAVITLRQELIAFYMRLAYLPNGEFKNFPENSALWQPKVAGLRLQYLVKSA